jgi:DNA-directed RNA polymerase specialized sigma24 family protein
MARLFLNPSDHSEQFICLWTGAQPKIANLIDEAISDFQQSHDILQNVALSCLREFSEYDERLPFVEWALVIARSRIRQAGFSAPPTCPNNNL